jgi:hypothetical protein
MASSEARLIRFWCSAVSRKCSERPARAARRAFISVRQPAMEFSTADAASSCTPHAA